MEDFFQSRGLRVFSFDTNDYDDLVDERFKLNIGHSLGYLVISEPDYFEKSILPKILASEEEIANPIDIVTKEILSESPITCKNVRDIIHDYTMLPNRQPKILMQTVMHISGCAYLYQKADVTNVEELNKRLPDNLKDQRLLGVCLHPEFGGYFSARTVVLTDTQIDEKNWRKIEPARLLKKEEDIIDLLVEMNVNWAEGKWRDFGEPTVRYSHQAKRYFDAAPKDRPKIIEEIRSKSCAN